MSPIRLAIISTHPIQYYVPLYREVFGRPDIAGEVLFASDHGLSGKALDPDFGERFDWDINLTDGYPHKFLKVLSRFNQPTVNAVRWLTNISTAISSEKYDVVVVPGYRPLFELQALTKCFLSKIPVMLRPEGYDRSILPSLKNSARTKYLQWIYKNIDAYLAIGTRSKKHFLSHGGDAAKIIESPYCVDNPFFQDGAELNLSSRDEFRHRLKVDKEKLVVVFVGKMIPRKRPLILAEAISRAKHKDNIHVIWVGSGLLLQEVKDFYHANRLVGTFTGFSNQSELAQYYSAADLHVLSSAEETWGLVVNETMNFSLPQIVTNGAACGNDLVEGKGNGFVVPIDNASALAEKLDWFFENRSKCAEMGRKSLEVIRHWGVKEAADGIVIGARRLVLRK